MTFIQDIASFAQRIQKNHDILASIVMAQAIHESNWGRSILAVRGKNLFGIKGAYQGQSITMKTWEVIDGRSVYTDAAFRKYPSWYESFEDLVNLYKNGVSWDRTKYQGVVGEKDYKRAARAIQAAGYATDPQYAVKIIANIEAHKLTQYDQAAPPPSQPPKPKTYKIVRNIPGYRTADDAKSSTVVPGDYYVFKESAGMVNATTKQETPESWINPGTNSAPANPPVKGDHKTNSIVDYLKSIGLDSSMANRTKLAENYGISNYTGTADQNIQLLNRMRK